MGLSSNIIWHQTTYNGLKAILHCKAFKPSYSLETIRWKGSVRDVAFPMISFCDIPIADMHEYIEKYGNYTIGMKRDWGQKERLSPVWYRDITSSTLGEQMDLFKNILGKEAFKLEEMEKILWNIIAYTKNTEGELRKRNYKSYRFQDEKEVRFVPAYDELVQKGVAPFLSKDAYDKMHDEGSTIIGQMEVSFDIADIAYILVSKRNQIGKVKKLLEGRTENITFLSSRQIRQEIIGLSHNRLKNK